MTTFVISEQANGWAVLRMGQSVTYIASAQTEELARLIAFENVRKEPRSCVVRFSKAGQTQFIPTPQDHSRQFHD